MLFRSFFSIQILIYKNLTIFLTPDATRLAALLHYADEGRRAGFRPNACFDPEFYRRQMQAAGQTGDPLLHYLRQGLHEGRYPCPEVAALARRQRPCISILTPVYNTSENQLWRCVHSVLMQPWPYWQLCLVDDGSTETHVAPRSEEHTSELQSPANLVCRLLLEKKN